jgi:cobalt-zinc-cadmium efflux system outer membrane protein
MMWRTISVVSIAAGVLASASVGAQERPLTTSDLVQLAIERNRDLLAERQRVAEAEGLLRQAGVRLSPTVEFEGATGRPLGTRGEEEYTASYFQPVEIGGKRRSRIAVGEHGVALAQAELADRIRQLAYDVKTRVADARASQRKNEALGRLLVASRESFQLTKARVDEGDAALLEQQLLSTEIGRTEAEKAAFAGRALSAILDLRRVVGLPTGQPLGLAGDAPIDRDLVLRDLAVLARNARPDLKAAATLEMQATAEVNLARAEGVPDLTVSARYTRRTSTFENLYGFTALGTQSALVDRDHVLTFGVSVPLFAPGRNRGNVDAAVARLSAARLHREYLETTVQSDVEAAYERWTAARLTVGLFQRDVVDQSERNLGVVRQAYTLGQLRLLDVLNEQRRLVDTELAYVDAQTELAEATADLERAVGSDLP